MRSINRRRTLKRDLAWIFLVVSVVLSAAYLGLDLSTLFNNQGLDNARNLTSDLLKPQLDSQYLGTILWLSIESILIGVLGTVIGVAAGILLAVGAARLPDIHEAPGKSSAIIQSVEFLIRQLFHFVLALFRTIPDMVWAVLLVLIIGLGPGAAVIAIAVVTCGITGKLFAELAETTDPELLASSRTLGMKNYALWWHCVLPQVKRQWMAYSLFRLECNIRNSTILGIVGAGGLGSEILLSIKYFNYAKLSTALMAVLLIIILLELASAWLRQRPVKYASSLAITIAVLAIFILDIPWRDLFSGNIQGNNFSWSVKEGLVLKALSLSFETILMAWCATMVAALLALLISPMVARTLNSGNYLNDTYQHTGIHYRLKRLIRGSLRMFFQLVRAMPEITFALIFVIWVGAGPLAGILAIGLHTFGVLGRLYSDVYEEVEPESAAMLQSAGLKQYSVWLFAVMPQIFPRLMAFTLYRFEVNIRTTAVVGFVGAGGIGDEIHTAFSYFLLGDLLVLLSVLFLVVVIVDAVGRRIRINILNRSYVQAIHPLNNQQGSKNELLTTTTLTRRETCQS